jgi:hypothetical protein
MRKYPCPLSIRGFTEIHCSEVNVRFTTASTLGSLVVKANDLILTELLKSPEGLISRVNLVLQLELNSKLGDTPEGRTALFDGATMVTF